MHRLKSLSLVSVLVRSAFLGVLVVALDRAVSDVAERTPDGTGVPIVTVLILSFLAFLPAVAWGVVDGYRGGRRAADKVSGQWLWGVAICLFVIVANTMDRALQLLSDPKLANALQSFAEALAVIVDLLLVQSIAIAYLGTAVIGAYTLTFNWARKRGTPAAASSLPRN